VADDPEANPGVTKVAGALGHFRVIDLSGSLGAYCTKLLADFGADVIKVEPPAGDVLRHRGPFFRDVPDLEGSLSFAFYHQNKRGVTLDLEHVDARPILDRLEAIADVLVLAPPNIRRMEAARDTSDVSDQVVCAITPYGLTGPYRNAPATHLTSSAMGGIMVSARNDEAPLRMPDQQAYDDVATHAALAILVALRNREQVGGQFVEISAHDVMATKNHAIARFGLSGYDELQKSLRAPPPAGDFMCTDGVVQVQMIGTIRHWTAFKELVGNPPELDEPGWDDPVARRRDSDRLRALVEPMIARYEKEAFVSRAQALGVPSAPINTLREFAEDAQTIARGTFDGLIDHPYLGRYPEQRLIHPTEPLLRPAKPAPLLGQHNCEVYVDELGYQHAELERWREQSLV
jgi:crotonobetainyl-CoA:carnitine CoA-transferase CaiB-like acyl-CoA transferase